MSKLSEALHAAETTVEAWLGHLPPEGQAAVKSALSNAQSVASTSVVVNSGALSTVWDALEKGIEATVTAAEIALLGPAGGQIAAELSDAALEAISAKAKSSVDAKIAAAAASRQVTVV